MKKSVHSLSISTTASILAIFATTFAIEGCGGSKESASNTPSKAVVEKEAPPSEPTMENMKSAIVDAIQTISSDKL
jgi:hypothetical protein